MKRGDVVKMKKPAVGTRARQQTLAQMRLATAAAFLAARAALRVGVIIEVIEVIECLHPAGDQCVVYWSDNIKSTHWATDLEMK